MWGASALGNAGSESKETHDRSWWSLISVQFRGKLGEHSMRAHSGGTLPRVTQRLAPPRPEGHTEPTSIHFHGRANAGNGRSSTPCETQAPKTKPTSREVAQIRGNTPLPALLWYESGTVITFPNLNFSSVVLDLGNGCTWSDF